MPPLCARVKLVAMEIKGYSASPKAPALLEPHHQIVWCHIRDTCCVRVLGGYPSAEAQLVYSTAPTADWAIRTWAVYILYAITPLGKTRPYLC